jgi:hypothetical protein
MADPLSLIGDVLTPFALITQRQRLISYIMPDVVIEEVHRDTTMITDHPVETGAAISDHAFMMPAELEMACGFSNSTGQSEGYVQQQYQALLQLQATREPFDVTTGKRQYTSMLIRNITVTNDEKWENALNILVSLRRIIIVDTDGGGAGGGPAMMGSPTDAGSFAASPTGGAVPTFGQTTSIDYMSASTHAQSGYGSFGGLDLGTH